MNEPSMMGLFFSFGLLLLSSAMLLAPLEALAWWAGWYGRRSGFREDIWREVADIQSEKAPQEHYIIFLDGIAKGTRDSDIYVTTFLEQLAMHLKDAVIIADIVPYAVTGIPLTKSRPMAKLWRFLWRRKHEHNDPIGFFINLRNLYQVMVSADNRYGAIYHLGEAQMIVKRLLEQGYPIASGHPITLIGYSGGAQVAAGVAPYLKHIMRAPVDLISLGGVLSADKGLDDLRYVYHLAGSKDAVEKLGAVLFPGRWLPWGTSWKRAIHKGKLTYIPMAKMAHNNEQGYLDPEAYASGGSSHLSQTLHLVKDILCKPEEVFAQRVRRGQSFYRYNPELVAGKA